MTWTAFAILAMFICHLSNITITMNIKVDPAMMAALMAACSVIQTGANTEEVVLIMVMDGDDNIMILR